MQSIHFSKKHKDTFNTLGILAIYLFGSQVKDTAHPLSDIDIGVIFEKPENYRENTGEVYQTLYGIFSDVLPPKYLQKRFSLKEHEFDIVFLQFTPISFQFNAITEGNVVYEKDQHKRLDYHEYVIKRYLDLQYAYRLRSRIILQRI